VRQERPSSKDRPLELKPPRQDGARVAILRGAAALGFGAPSPRDMP
jgi:hypothetical protein